MALKTLRRLVVAGVLRPDQLARELVAPGQLLDAVVLIAPPPVRSSTGHHRGGGAFRERSQDRCSNERASWRSATASARSSSASTSSAGAPRRGEEVARSRRTRAPRAGRRRPWPAHRRRPARGRPAGGRPARSPRAGCGMATPGRPGAGAWPAELRAHRAHALESLSGRPSSTSTRPANSSAASRCWAGPRPPVAAELPARGCGTPRPRRWSAPTIAAQTQATARLYGWPDSSAERERQVALAVGLLVVAEQPQRVRQAQPADQLGVLRVAKQVRRAAARGGSARPPPRSGRAPRQPPVPVGRDPRGRSRLPPRAPGRLRARRGRAAARRSRAPASKSPRASAARASEQTSGGSGSPPSWPASCRARAWISGHAFRRVALEGHQRRGERGQQPELERGACRGRPAAARTGLARAPARGPPRRSRAATGPPPPPARTSGRPRAVAPACS